MAIKRIDVHQSEKLLSEISEVCTQFGVKTDLGKLGGRDACIAAEVIIDAVDAHRINNRVPRPKKTPAPPPKA